MFFKKRKSIIAQSSAADDVRSAGDPGAYVADTHVSNPADDRFKRHPFAQRLAATLAHRGDASSIVVHIHGAWGEGKTTVLEFIRHELNKCDDVIPVFFNPWRITDEITLLASFFSTVGSALDAAPKMFKERVGDVVRDYGSFLSELDVEVHGVKVTAGKGLTKLVESLSQVTLDDQRRRIENLLGKAGARVVVIIDDIDRLDRKEAQAVFKLLKLSGNLSHISYLVAFDRAVVASAIADAYGLGVEAGYAYLEKIIQVSLDLPAADPDTLAAYCFDLIGGSLMSSGVTLSPEEQLAFQSQFTEYLAWNIATPRVAKRYANAVAFTLPILAGC